MNNSVYLLNIRLLHIEPSIWRRFVVPGIITLDRMHDVIQIVMGWTDSHLHQFTIGKKKYTEEPEKGRSFQYLYDFGDNWEHDVMVESNRYDNPDLRYALACLDGAGACPPENVGGTHGFEEFCRVLGDPEDEEHEHCTAWYRSHHFYDAVFDRHRCDLEKINNNLINYERWSRDRVLARGSWDGYGRE